MASHTPDPVENEWPLRGGELNAAITSALVGIHNKHMGRGPKSASTHCHDTVVVTIMHDVMTRAEKGLAVERGDAVIAMRHLYQQAMEDDYRAAVERLTGRRVVAFMSGNHADPDVAAEVFLLDAPVGGEPSPERAA